ncbi:MAG TPA: L-histidine N(alpha)-methyltransferase [Longimicrobium sp.]|jgi:L-histidine N-alpha-methyltransferase|uniref:L-histidine N(alpha)-methyltransferase n=1 Tax=Longimicrobium sp. TaxID=2029185 RepID=UPI002ED99D40
MAEARTLTAPRAAPDAQAAREVADGLRRAQPELPPKFFYDEAGSRLFEEITRLPEYYLTRTERALMQRWMPAWIGPLAPAAMVELGAGSAEKTTIVLDAIAAASPRAVYVPVDVSGDFLDETAVRIRAAYPSLQVQPVVADFTEAFDLPDGLGGPVLHAFLGSTIGNFAPDDAVQLLRRVRARMAPGDRFLLGVDQRKNPARIEAAYNDAAGVTAQFNLNMLRVVNTLAGTDFNVSRWEHRAFYNGVEHRIEMHLVSVIDQTVTVPGSGEFAFRAGQTIRTEISAKHDHDSVEAMFAAAGLRIDEWVTDRDGLYALVLASPAD